MADKHTIFPDEVTLLIFAIILIIVMCSFGCAHDVEWKEVAGETPHYGLFETKTPTGPCYVYTEKDNGVALWCKSK